MAVEPLSLLYDCMCTCVCLCTAAAVVADAILLLRQRGAKHTNNADSKTRDRTGEEGSGTNLE